MFATLVTLAVIAPDLQTTAAADGTAFVRQAVETSGATAALAKSRTIYLNRNGGTVRPGANDARTNTSSIAKQMVELDGWAASPQEWAATLACVKAIWAPFDVVVTDEDPGSGDYLEAMVGDNPASLGLPANVGGVAPMSTTCGVIEHAIVFAFPSKLGNKPQKVCEVISQELGHAYGLDHELEPKDPMTYLSYSGKRTFQDKTVACGETEPRPCGLEGHTCSADQNTVAFLRARVGVAGEDNVPPDAQITSPADHAVVEAGFMVVASALDNDAVESVTLFVDGVQGATRFEAPFEFATDPALAAGYHTLTIEAVDANGNMSTHELVVQIGAEPDAFDGVGDAARAACSTGRATSFAPMALVLLALLRRRRATTSRA